MRAFQIMLWKMIYFIYLCLRLILALDQMFDIFQMEILGLFGNIGFYLVDYM